MRRTELDERLSTAAKYVRQGAVFADIGTDHAYLPLFLLENGVILHAYAADIAEGPLSRARRAVGERGYLEKVTLLLANGLCGMEELGLTDIAICGMGGETVAEILRAAPFVRREGVRLILQPMTKAALLRRALGEMGFRTVEEAYVPEEGKLYAVLCAEYDGHPRVLTPLEAEIGPRAMAHPTKETKEAAERLGAVTRRRLEGLRRADRPDGAAILDAEGLLSELTKWRKSL